MTRECISHHICDCHQEKMERLEARIEELKSVLWRAHPFVDDSGWSEERESLLVEMYTAFSDTREKK